MPANVKIYSDSDCEHELTVSDIYYELELAPVVGLDGDAGDRSDVHLYLKNVGDKPAMFVTVTKDSDDANRITFSNGNTDYKAALQLADIAANAVADLLVRLMVTAGTQASLVNPNIHLNYKTLP